MAINSRKITVKGSKDRFRDFVYIDDVVEAFIKALSRENGYDVFNICTGRAITVETVVNTIVSSMPFEVRTEYVDGTPGDQFGIFGCNEKAISNLDWRPNVRFEDGMKKMIDWALAL